MTVEIVLVLPPLNMDAAATERKMWMVVKSLGALRAVMWIVAAVHL